MGTVRSRFFTACAAIVLIAATPPDSAVILGSRPNDANAYQIAVGSDGSASITSASGFRAFTLPEAVVKHLFAALAASGKDSMSGACAKKAPFDATIRVRWNGWVSGDVTCPPSEPDPVAAVALNNAVMRIIVLAGPPAATPRSQLPPEDQPPN
ncbi:MAG TPA: hypothetical protein VGG51_00535 [Candidatus Cybelea sp.]|jgi:hypothetical protein